MTYQPPDPKHITLSPDQILRLARLFRAEDAAREDGYPYSLYKAAYGLRAYHPSSFDSDTDLSSVASMCDRALMAVDAILQGKPEDDDPFNPMGWLDGDGSTIRSAAVEAPRIDESTPDAAE